MLRYHIAFYLPKAPGDMVVAEALDFPGAVTQGFDLPDACRYRFTQASLRSETARTAGPSSSARMRSFT
jgi:hypothetical protein